MSLTDRVGPKEQEKRLLRLTLFTSTIGILETNTLLRLFVQNTVGYMIKIVFNTFEYTTTRCPFKLHLLHSKLVGAPCMYTRVSQIFQT